MRRVGRGEARRPDFAFLTALRGAKNRSGLRCPPCRICCLRAGTTTCPQTARLRKLRPRFFCHRQREAAIPPVFRPLRKKRLPCIRRRRRADAFPLLRITLFYSDQEGPAGPRWIPRGAMGDGGGTRERRRRRGRGDNPSDLAALGHLPPCGARKMLRANAFPCIFRPLRK